MPIPTSVRDTIRPYINPEFPNDVQVPITPMVRNQTSGSLRGLNRMTFKALAGGGVYGVVEMPPEGFLRLFCLMPVPVADPDNPPATATPTLSGVALVSMVDPSINLDAFYAYNFIPEIPLETVGSVQAYKSILPAQYPFNTFAMNDHGLYVVLPSVILPTATEDNPIPHFNMDVAWSVSAEAR